MRIQFTIAEWAAWAPGLETADAWRVWARQPFPPHGQGTPALGEVPAMQRRRIDRLGRMAIQTAYWCQRAEAEGIPFVFASRHGDVACSVELLESLSRRETLSPTSFGLSVHNAIAALYSIVRGERGNYLALAAGHATPEAALVEAAGLLGDGRLKYWWWCTTPHCPRSTPISGTNRILSMPGAGGWRRRIAAMALPWG